MKANLPAETVLQLKKIAPVVTLATVGWEGIDPLDEVRTVGELLGRGQQADEFIARYKRKVEEAKAKLSEIIGPDETIARTPSGRKISGYGRKRGTPAITCTKC